jgi:hypothetical protein
MIPRPPPPPPPTPPPPPPHASHPAPPSPQLFSEEMQVPAQDKVNLPTSATMSEVVTVPLTRSATDGFAPAASQTCVHPNHAMILHMLTDH